MRPAALVIVCPDEATAAGWRAGLAARHAEFVEAGHPQADHLLRVRVVVGWPAPAPLSLTEAVRRVLDSRERVRLGTLDEGPRARSVEMPPPIRRLAPELLARADRAIRAWEMGIPPDPKAGRKTWPEPRGRARAGGRR